MSVLIDTIEGRLQVKIGQLTFENEVLRQQIDDKDREIADLRVALDKVRSSEGGSQP